MATLTVPGIIDSIPVDLYDMSESMSVAVTRPMDTGSQALAAACVNGTPVGDVTLVADGGAGTFIFANSFVSSYQPDGDHENVRFSYQAMSNSGS
jgi:hypothetical protein